MNRFGTFCLGLLIVFTLNGLQASVRQICSIAEVGRVVCDCFKQKTDLLRSEKSAHISFDTTTDSDCMRVSAADRERKVAREAEASAIWLVILFDLDNVLIQPADASRVGSDQWFSAVFDKGIKLGLRKDQILTPFLEAHFKLQKQIDLTLVEKDAVALIDYLQKIPGVAVMGLTARSMQIAERTIAELNRLGIDFSKGALCGKEHEVVYEKLSYPACFCGGVIFCGENKKADMLERVFTDVHCNPTHLIFTDDKESNVNNLASAMESKGYHVDGLRYAGSDEEAKKFKLNDEWLGWIEDLYVKLSPCPRSMPAIECKPISLA